MPRTGLGWLSVLAASASVVVGDASSPQPVAISTVCLPERSATSACVWTADCLVPGCRDKCTANWETMNSWWTLLDRSVGESFYSACPDLAEWTHIALDFVRGPGRRLLSDNDIKASSLQHMASRQRIRRNTAHVHGTGNRRSMLSLSDMDAPSPATSLASSPSSIPFVAIPANRCPNADEVEEAAQTLADFASRFRRVFELDAAGEPLPSDLEDLSYAVEEPNRFGWLLSMMEAPGRIANYLTSNCIEQVIRAPRSWEYEPFLSVTDQDRLDSNSTMLQCVDNFGAWEDFARKYADVKLVCNPPFGLNPNCFSGVGHYMVTSPACATAYARMWNITDATPLASVAATVNAIQDSCSEVTTEAECLAADTPALDAIVDIHDTIPVAHEIEFSGVTLATVPDVGPICFGDDCPTPEDVPPTPSPQPSTAPGPGPPAPRPAPTPEQQAPLELRDNDPAEVDTSESARCTVYAASAAVAALLIQLLYT